MPSHRIRQWCRRHTGIGTCARLYWGACLCLLLRLSLWPVVSLRLLKHGVPINIPFSICTIQKEYMDCLALHSIDSCRDGHGRYRHCNECPGKGFSSGQHSPQEPNLLRVLRVRIQREPLRLQITSTPLQN